MLVLYFHDVKQVQSTYYRCEITRFLALLKHSLELVSARTGIVG